MTVVEERVGRGTEAGRLHAGASRPLATGRFAARLARREVRRRPGRTLLVALLVAVPVLAMTVASVLYRTGDDDWATAFARRAGSADLLVEASPDASVPEVVRGVLPDGSRTLVGVQAWTGLEQADGTTDPDVWVRFTDLPLEDPMVDGIVEVRAGRAPTAPDEVLLDGRTADHLDVGVGDVLALARPAGDWRVVGIGRLADNHGEGLMVVAGFDPARLRDDAWSQRVLVDLPAGTTRAEGQAVASRLVERGVGVDHRWAAPPQEVRADVSALAWGWVVGVLALVAVGIVIAAAFATSARRQLVTIGHLSANGAPAALVRRTLALQGSWTGLLGVATGMAGATAGLVLLRPLAERVARRSLGSYVVAPLDLVVIAATAVVAATVAAAVPARGAARVPVLSALAGRRPLAAPPRRLVPVGVALFLGGLGLLFVAATGANSLEGSGGGDDVFAAVAVLGALGVVFGMCCATPLAVEAVGRLGARSARGTWRLAARSTARVRTRSAGVVTAVATTAAFAVAGVTIAASAVSDEVEAGSLPRDVAVLHGWSSWPEPDAGGMVDPPPLAPMTLDGGLRASIDRLIPGARWTPLRAAGIDPPPFDAERGPGRTPGTDAAGGPEAVSYDAQVALVADPEVLDLTGLDDDGRALLEEVDVVEVGAWRFSDNPRADGDVSRSIRLADADGDVVATLATASNDGWSPWPGRLITAARASALGLDVVVVGEVLRTPEDLTDTQRRELQQLVWADDTVRTAFVEPGDPPAGVPGGPGDSGVSVEVAWSTSRLPVALINTLIVAAAVLLTLLVVAIGLALSATESRDERDVLVAVGAPPRTLSRVAGAKAVVLATTGVLLAVPTGWLPTWVVSRTMGEGVSFPGPTVALLVVVVPAVAGVAAWATSAAARRLRPVRLSTTGAD